MNEDDLFQRLILIPLPDLADFLARETAGDPGLRRRLEVCLAEFDHAAPASEEAQIDVTIDSNPGHSGRGTDGGATPSSGSNEPTMRLPPGLSGQSVNESAARGNFSRPGEWIDNRYQLLEIIGQGGMGSVWIAEQFQPVRRRVAIKLIRADRDSQSIVNRFEAERQALAMMEHPGIARVFDGGTTTTGQPYFVMELVDGVPLTEFCDRHNMPILERLELFVQVCNAVQHAHQKGLIHRDLKPGNVLVTRVDGKPAPKVIDFGLARATGGGLVDESIGEAGAIVGTPAYMSPEQVSPGDIDIDTRADVYALGVILYELLVGVPPLDARQFQRAAVLEMLRMVREVDPPRPSTRLSSADNLPNIAANRAIEPAELMRWVRGDIDWIVMKALEKDRDRRYNSPHDFAADVRRFLTHQPVVARPASRTYLFRKFLRRHRGPVIAAGLLLMALLAGIVGTTWGMLEARRQQSLAIKAADREKERAEGERLAKLAAEESAASERAANELTRKRLIQIERGSELIYSIFDDLDIRNVRSEDQPLEAVLAGRLVAAGKELDRDNVGEPLVVAALQHKLGTSLLSLGFPEEAIPLFEKAHRIRSRELGHDNRDTIGSLVNLGEALGSTGKSSQAIPLLQTSFDSLKKLNGMEHPDTVMALSNLAVAFDRGGQTDRAVPMLEKVLETRKRILGADHFDTLTSMVNLAHAYGEKGELQRALGLQKETHERMEKSLGENHHDTLLALINMSIGYKESGNLPVALSMMEAAHEKTQTHLGKNHPTTLIAMNNLGTALWMMGHRDRGFPLIEQGYRLSREKLGESNPQTLIRMRNLVGIYSSMGKLNQSVQLGEECAKLTEKVLGVDHPDSLASQRALASSYAAAGQFEQALSMMTLLLDRSTEELGRDHPSTLVAINELAGVYMAIGQNDRALELLQESLRLKTEKFGGDHPETLADKGNVAVILRQAGMTEQALPLMQDVLDSMTTRLGPNHPNTIASRYNMAVALLVAGKVPEAMSMYDQFKTGYESEGGNDQSRYAMLLTLFSRRLLAVGEHRRAEESLQKALNIRESIEPDLWSTYATKALLGQVLAVKKEYGNASSLMVDGYEGMKVRLDSIPAEDRQMLVETVDQLIEVYTATEDETARKQWQAERETWADPPANSDSSGRTDATGSDRYGSQAECQFLQPSIIY